MRNLLSVVFICLLLGCSSRNVVYVRGENLRLSYGFLGMEGADSILILRETSIGNKKDPLPPFQYDNIPEYISIAEPDTL